MEQPADTDMRIAGAVALLFLAIVAGLLPFSGFPLGLGCGVVVFGAII